MTTGVVVGSILLAANQHLRVEERAVAASADLVNGRRVEIDEERARNMLATAGLGEKGLVGARVTNVLGVRVGTTIGTEAMLKKVAIKISACLSSPVRNIYSGKSCWGQTYSSQAELPSWVPACPRWR